jgi:Allene oxide cyclase barrel like domain
VSQLGQETVDAAGVVEFTIPPFGPAPDDPSVADRSRALLLHGISERLISYESNNDDPEGKNPTLDDAATVAYELFDGETSVGTTKGIGRMLYRKDDGGYVAYYSEVISLHDGTVIRTGGFVDDTALTAGEQATIQAVAVSGPYAGAVGYRQFRPIVPHEVYASNIVLYHW